MPVKQGNGVVRLEHSESGSSATIHMHGANVTSWRSKGVERLWLSSKACLDGSRPIFGGIPIVFPNFAEPPKEPPDYAALPFHGFVHAQTWSLGETVTDDKEGVSVRLSAPGPPATFPHDYSLAYVVTLTANQLSSDVIVSNTSSTATFRFQALLHNYLAVSDIDDISITGLDGGVEYRDKNRNFERRKCDGRPLVIREATDCIFEKVPTQKIRVDDGAGHGFSVAFKGFEDCTIWNPKEGGRSIDDMEEGGWERYVCIEPGFVREFKVLQPGEQFVGRQVITAL